ncbi:helix-hairpin-helix domain-containing protein [Streptomyces coeruleorubidus]|uniref:Helix-hairpin-helix domain-containing protein n=1 Tax=Streptomyces coeruleorubidus TaxID=116188 RepID=A0ABZ0KIW4_STRC4|nr:helix-hairpin-helix domain-containing protein [Streptomyces coeruleorubidus]WOT37962.1 helix-hairpin-helix domain-containing protein [Streptomyces coeruleorubidus]
MSTEPETTEDAEPGTPTGGAEPGATEEDAAGSGEVPEAEVTEGEAAPSGEAPAAEGTEGDAAASGELSAAEAELRAQRAERERIEQRKAEKKTPIEAGTKLSGKAADLLAAVRAVESGEKPVATVFEDPEPAPRRSAPEQVRRPQPVAAEAVAASTAPAPSAVQAVRQVLGAGGAPEALAPQVAAALGEGADELLRADPWQLLRVAAVRPEQADGFARALLGAECGPDDERRGRAVTVWLLEQAALAGHTALEMPALLAALAQRGVPDPDSAVQDAIAEGDALVFQDALEDTGAAPARTEEEGTEEDEERPVRVLVGLERYALAEESLADGLARLVNSVPKQDGSAEDWERVAAAAQGSTGELLRAVAAHGLVLHTGGEASLTEPAALLTAAHTLGLRAWAATHGPIGRTRFAALLHRSETGSGTPSTDTRSPGAHSPVATVAGLLSGAEGPGRDADGALDLDLLVVLDAPQLDVETAALLTESLPDGARLVLAGDPGVLWSVGPGRVFADLLAARICPQVASRQPDPGPLGELVSGIGIGELNQVQAPGKEVVIVPVRDAGEAVHRTVQLVVDSVPRAIGVPAEETQVITPGHGGAVGTRALNAALKERLNPGPGRFGGFDLGDRIVYSPVPGRALPGRVVKADAEGLHLSCEGEDVVVPKERVEQSVRHGWALTAHQAVGSRWPAVVVVLPGDAAQALSRPWVYTAFGRADRHLSVVHGVEQALARAVAEVPAKPRTTRLPVLLAPQISG